MASQSAYSAEEIARLGDAIYEAEIRPQVEASYRGQVVAIDIKSHSYIIAENALAASQRLLALHPEAEIWCVRVGHRSLHRIFGGLSYGQASSHT